MTFRRLLIDHHLRRALMLWLCLAVAVCVKSAIISDPHSVYPQFAAASHHWWVDKSLYDDYSNTEHIDGYRYSPAFAIAFSPLAYVPARLGTMIWDIVSILVLVWALHVFARDVLPGCLPPKQEGVFLALALPGSAIGIWSAQSNAIVIALIMLAMAAIVRQRWWPAAILLAIPVFIKIWPLAVVLLLLVFWPRQLGWRFAVACAVLAILPFLTRPPSMVAWQYHEWYAGLTGKLQGRWAGYRDAWTIWETLRPQVSHLGYQALQLLGAIGVFGWCCWQYRRLNVGAAIGARATGTEVVVANVPLFSTESRRQPPPSPSAANGIHGRQECLPHFLLLMLSMWAAWQLFLGPGAEQLTYGIIAPSAAWAVIVSFREKRARWLTVTAWAMLALLPSGDIEKGVLRVFPEGKVLLPLAVVLFLAWLVWHECGACREDVVSKARRTGPLLDCGDSSPLSG